MKWLARAAIGLFLLSFAGCYYQEQRSARTYFTNILSMPGIDFASNLQHDFNSLDTYWTGELTGGQQAQLLTKHWRTQPEGTLPATVEESPGNYYWGPDSNFAYTLRVTGLEAGLSPDKFEQVASGASRRVSITLHSTGGI